MEFKDYTKDAIYFSGHKFLGGPGTPGILCLKNSIMDKYSIGTYPSIPGGGTVVFVTKVGHKYLDNYAEREEGGTPNIIQNIKLSMAFQIKEKLSIKRIVNYEQRYLRIFLYYCKDIIKSNNLQILGNNYNIIFNKKC